MANSPTGWSLLRGLFGSTPPPPPRQAPTPDSQVHEPKASEQLPELARPLADVAVVHQPEPGGPQEDVSAAEPEGASTPTSESSLQEDDLRQLSEYRRLVSLGHYNVAAAICDHYFSQRPRLRDEFGHPIYYKEKLRLALFADEVDVARTFEEKMQPLIDQQDPGIQILFARHFSRVGDMSAAEAAWNATLKLAPDNLEAQYWFTLHAKEA